jgi:Acetyltransferase (GNAT) domain
MRPDEYHLRWLTPRDAWAMARLESRVYPRKQRAGFAQIREQLRMALHRGTSLSIGLFAGRRLVGYFHAFLARQLADVWDYYGEEPPAEIPIGGAGIFIDDFVIYPEHRRAAGMMTMRMSSLGRNLLSLRGVPLCAFSTAEYRDIWKARAAVLARAGWVLKEEYESFDDDWGATLHWLVFRHSPPKAEQRLSQLTEVVVDRESAANRLEVGVINTFHGWHVLAEHWPRLLPPDATPFDSFEYLLTWSTTIGIEGRLALLVATRDGVPVAVLPTHTMLRRYGGHIRRTLEFMGSRAEQTRALFDGRDIEALNALAKYVVERRKHWDCVALTGQRPDDSFVAAVCAQAQDGRHQEFTTTWISPGHQWTEYLNAGPDLARQTEQSVRHLRARGPVSLEIPTADETALERYVSVERNRWACATRGSLLRRSPALRLFYSELLHRMDSGLSTTFHFLMRNGEPLAGSIGLPWRKTYFLLRTTPPLASGRGATTLLTRVVEALFLAADFERVRIPAQTRLKTWITQTTHSLRVSIGSQPRLLASVQTLLCKFSGSATPKSHNE